jgi:hypothetical protein
MLNRLLPSVLWPLVIVLATWGAWAVVTREEPIHRPGPARINEPIDKIPPAVVDQPVLEEVSADGTVRWTLYLDRITREEGSVMELAQPRALYRFQSGEALEVNARMGTYDEEAGILRLTGDVRGSARNTAFAFSVNQMTWDSVAGLLTASGGVEVTRDGIRLEGENLVLDLSQEFERIQVTGGVEITSAPEVIENLSRFDLERPG